MFDLVSILARYLFVLYIVYFLWQGVVYILNERGHRDGDPRIASKKQRYTIVAMHIVAFAVLFVKAWYKDGVADYSVLIMGGGALSFIIFSFVTTNRIYKNGCPLLFNGMLFLLDTGFILLQRLDPALAQRQLIFCAAGFLVMLCMPLVFKIIPRFEKLEYVYLIVGFLLIFVLFFYGSQEHGAVGWLTVGALTFQPSEFSKVFFVLYFACALSKGAAVWKSLILCVVAAAFVAVLVLQRDLGAALLFFMTFMIMLYVATGNLLLFFSGIGAAAAASVAAYRIFPHIQERVLAWANPWQVIDDEGYQITQSLFALCTWGPFGSGLYRGQPESIPVVTKDFVFSAATEEFGSVFGLLLIGVYIMIFYRGVHIALRCGKPFFSLVSVGLTGLLAFQTFIILGGVIKLIPMTGVTMPFVSYGGSSVFICVIMIGFLEWLYKATAKERSAEAAAYIDLTEG